MAKLRAHIKQGAHYQIPCIRDAASTIQGGFPRTEVELFGTGISDVGWGVMEKLKRLFAPHRLRRFSLESNSRMKILSLFVAVMLLMPILTACSSYQGDIQAADQNLIEKIIIKKSTKGEVHALLGDSSSIMEQGSKEIWSYNYQQTNYGARLIPFSNLVNESSNDIKTAHLTIKFDKNGLVDEVKSSSRTTKPQQSTVEPLDKLCFLVQKPQYTTVLKGLTVHYVQICN